MSIVLSKNRYFEETAFIVSNMLQSAADTGGTAHRLKGFKVAAKTGTVQLPPDVPEFKNIDGTNDAGSSLQPRIHRCCMDGF